MIYKFKYSVISIQQVCIHLEYYAMQVYVIQIIE